MQMDVIKLLANIVSVCSSVGPRRGRTHRRVGETGIEIAVDDPPEGALTLSLPKNLSVPVSLALCHQGSSSQAALPIRRQPEVLLWGR